MTSRDPDYEALREAIRELRRADERDAPAFGALLTHERSRQPMTWSMGRLALAAGLVLAIGVGVTYRMTRPRPFTVPREVISLSTWRAMTDVLLETSNRSLLRETPQLGASLIPTGELR